MAASGGVQRIELSKCDVLVIRPWSRMNATDRADLESKLAAALPDNPVVVLQHDVNYEIFAPARPSR